jgi:GMP synthase (glutamine-hydrolysing)
MKIHIVIHESFEAPAAMELWAKNKGFEISYTRIYLGEIFPENVDGFDFLIVMGGPQSPATTLQEDPHFDYEKEVAFIKKAIDTDKYLMGVCLGAQMIGEALGAKFEHSPNREIGKFPITLTEDGKQDSNFSSFPEILAVGHWHGDMPGLTHDTKILAKSEGCPRQIVRYSPKIYGFQCHLEFTPEAIEGLIENSTKELEEYKDLPFIQNPETLRKNDYSEMNQFLYNFLDSLTG